MSQDTQIRHVVILMMSGHSYDNYLGAMAGRGDAVPSHSIWSEANALTCDDQIQ